MRNDYAEHADCAYDGPPTYADSPQYEGVPVLDKFERPRGVIISNKTQPSKSLKMMSNNTKLLKTMPSFQTLDQQTIVNLTFRSYSSISYPYTNPMLLTVRI